MIIGHGSDSADIMIVNDWGTKEDGKSGQALSGSQEATLRSFFGSSRYSLNNTYRTLFIKDILEYDGKAKKLKYAAIKQAFANGALKGFNYEEILRQEIRDVRPNVIMPLGDMALKFLSGYQPLSSYRGSVLPMAPSLQNSVLPDANTRILPALSPRMMRENITASHYGILDYQKAVRICEKTGPIEVPGMIWVCRTVEAFRNYINRQKDIMSRPEKDRFMTVDIETYLGIITAVGVSFDGKEAISIPFTRDGGVDYANLFLLQVEVAKLLASKVPKVNQNIKYDWIILERFGYVLNVVVGDTMLGFNLIYPELPKNLGFQNSIYTELPYFKDESSKKESAFNPKMYTKDSLYIYNAKDALATWQIHRKHQDEMIELGTDKIYNRLVPLIKIYKEIDERGLLVDQDKRKELFYKYKGIRDMLVQQIMDLVSPLFSFDDFEHCKKVLQSHVQVGWLIYECMKFPVRYKTTDGGKRVYKTDKDTLDDLMIIYGDQNKLQEKGRKVLSLIIAYRKLTKVLEYIKTPIHPDGVWRTTFNLAGTETGRTSASKSPDQIITLDEKGKLEFVRLGRSLQTITKHGFDIDGEIFDSVADERLGADLRSMFIPRKGYVFAEGDGSQAEARAVAVLAEDYELLKQFDIKPKIHARTAGMIFDLDPFTITKDFPVIPIIGVTYYDLGKRIRHAGNYNMGPNRLAQMTHIDFLQCEAMLKKFHETQPKIREYFHNEVYKALQHAKELRTPLGRVRQFFAKLDNHSVKEGYAYIPQSTISDHTKFAMGRICGRAPWAFPCYEGHDAFMAEIPDSRIDEFGKIFKEEYEVPISFRNCSLSRDVDLVIPCEYMIGKDNWQEMVEVKIAA